MRGGFRVVERGDGPRSPAESRGDTAFGHDHREHGLLGCLRPRYRAGDCLGHLGCARDDRRYEEDDERVDARVGEQHRDGALVGLPGGPSEHVDGVRDAGLRRKE